MEPKSWKKIPDRMQNAYRLMRKFSQQRIHEVSPIKLPRKKLPPISMTYAEGLSQSVITEYPSTKPENSPDQESEFLIKAEIAHLIKTSLNQYPKLENYIEKLKKEKISCKCSVFSKNIQSLDRVHAFSNVACASEYCINRILEEPDDQTTSTKNPEYYSLHPRNTTKKEVNQSLLLHEQNLDQIISAVQYVNSNKTHQAEYKYLYATYIKPPKSFNIPRHANVSPNFSVPKPARKRYLSYT